jgi:two-component system nitrogen regulation response regulator GlnG
MAKGDVLLLADIPREVQGNEFSNIRTSPGGAAPEFLPEGVSPAEPASLADALFRWARNDPSRKIIPTVERELIIRALTETKGNQVRAAKLLGITRATLRKRVEKYRIQRELQIS